MGEREALTKSVLFPALHSSLTQQVQQIQKETQQTLG